MRVRDRTLALCVAVAGVLALIAPAYAVNAIGFAVALAATAAALGLCPGLIVGLCVRPGRHPSLVQLLGVAVPLSLVSIQALTVLSLTQHLRASLVASVAIIALVIAATALAAYRWRSDHAIPVPIGEAILACAMLVLGTLLYLKGSPTFADEEQIHAAIVRRLATLPMPSIDSFYVAPGVVYTHPFPAIPFLMAMVSGLTTVDALFVYAKMRGVWCPMAIVLVYAAARYVLARNSPAHVESRRAAYVAAGTAAAFTLNGQFADFPNHEWSGLPPYEHPYLFWAQLAPYSHPSDVAMNVMLPALLVVAFGFLRAEERRDTVFFAVASLATLGVMTVSHIRETLQFCVYVGCFAIALLIARADREMTRRALLLTTASVVVMGAYVVYQRSAAPHVGAYAASSREALVATAADRPLMTVVAKLVASPSQATSALWETLLFGWFPITTVLAPVLYFSLGRPVLLLLVKAAVFAYAVLVRFPAAGGVLVLASFWEVLVTPARNVSFFVYLLTGPLLYFLAAAAGRLRGATSSLAATVLAGVVIGVVVSHGARLLVVAHDVYFAPLLLLSAVGVYFLRRGAVPPGIMEVAFDGARAQWARFAVLLVVALAVTWLPRSSPLTLSAVQSAPPPWPATQRWVGEPARMQEAGPCIKVPGDELRANRTFVQFGIEAPSEVVSCPMPAELVNWLRTALPLDAVLAVNLFSYYPPPPQAPQQVVAWPLTLSGNLANPDALFPKLYQVLLRSMRERGVQPVFNDKETREERVAVLRSIGATHVVVDPMYYELLIEELSATMPGLRSAYNQSRWAVFEVERP